MRVMVLVKATPDSEAGRMPAPEFFDEMGKFNEAMVAAGVMVTGEGLQPSAKGRRIRFEGTERTVIEGPFTGANELVSGFWLLRVGSMDEAIAWMKRSPFRTGEVELRPIFEAEDFGDALAPETREREASLRAALEAKTEGQR